MPDACLWLGSTCACHKLFSLFNLIRLFLCDDAFHLRMSPCKLNNFCVVTKTESRAKIWRETHFHSVTTQTQAVVTIYYHCIIHLRNLLTHILLFWHFLEN